MKTKFTILFSFLLCSSGLFAQYTQNTLSEMWTGSGGQGAMFHRNTVVADLNSSYVIGSTINGLNNSDVFIQKFGRYGALTWQQSYAGAGSGNDVAIDAHLYKPPGLGTSTSLYIAGTVFDSISNNQDLLVQKYSDAGVLQWTYKYHGSDSLPQDIGTAIVANGSTVYVTGSSATDSTQFDFFTVALNTSNGSVLWSQRYDYNNLNEAPAKIRYQSGVVYVTGASQDSLTGLTWSIATVAYNATTGAVISTNRINSNATSGVNDIADFAIDSQNNLFIVGAKMGDTTDLDIAIYKLDDSLNLIWEHFYDFNELADKGSGLKLDASGNIYVTGSSSVASLGTDVAILKLDPNGNEIWRKEFGGLSASDDRGVNLVLNGDKLFVAAAVNDYAQTDYKLYALDTSGVLLTTSRFEGAANLNDVPQGIAIDAYGEIIITGKEQTGASTFVNKTVKYSFSQKEYDFVTDSTYKYLEGSLLVRFRPNHIKTSTIDKQQFIAGTLEDFIDSTALSLIQAKTGNDWSRYATYKVVRKMTTADSLSVTRLGDTIKTDKMWSLLRIDIPTNWDIFAVCDSLDSLPSVVNYATPSYLAELYDTPSDFYYQTHQLSLYDNSSYPNAGINVEDAWDIEVGQPNVKVGVIDAPLNWQHEEFNAGLTNLPGPGKKIAGGWNYLYNTEINVGDQWSSDPHGISVAGIIGAKRNNKEFYDDINAKGIAGIAGGDDLQDNMGVELYSLGISNHGNFIPIFQCIEAMLEAAYSIPTTVLNPNVNVDKFMGLNIVNVSWGYDIPMHLSHPQNASLDVTLEMWKNHCILVAARGNDQGPSNPNPANFPACHADKRLLNVVASGTDGLRKTGTSNGTGVWNSRYGRTGAGNTLQCDVDFVAPGESLLIQTTTAYDTYSSFAGTSASAPHVAGVVALMYSKHNVVNGLPNNLATEDIEAILQKTAVDVDVSGYDLETGYGLINAHEALIQVSDPYYVLHVNSSNSATLMQSNLTVNLTQQDGWSQIYTNCKKYLVTMTVDETLPLGHEIIDYWDFEANRRLGNGGNLLMNGMPTNNNSFTGTLVANPIGGDQIQGTFYTYIYELNNGANGWWPFNLANVNMSYSLHVLKSPEAGVSENDNRVFSLFPNPTNQILNIQSNGLPIQQVQVFDLTGRMVLDQTVHSDQQTTINIANLKTGMYYCKIMADSIIESLPFIVKN